MSYKKNEEAIPTADNFLIHFAPNFALKKGIVLLCQSVESLLQVIEDVFKGRVSDTLTGFLRIVAAKGRYKELPGIFAYFTARVKEYKKIGVAEVTSAIPLTGAQKQRVEAKLLQTTPYETMEIEYKVDAAKIGGLMIRIGDRVVDGTVSSRLSALTSRLMKISLESEKEGVQTS